MRGYVGPEFYDIGRHSVGVKQYSPNADLGRTRSAIRAVPRVEPILRATPCPRHKASQPRAPAVLAGHS